jgi:uncharacterized membrane protein YbhN (UPF0104 family)
LSVTQIAVTIALLSWLSYTLDVDQALSIVFATSPLLFFGFSLMLAVLVVPAAIRWRWLIGQFLHNLTAAPNFQQSVHITTVNVVLNQFLPSTVGGDLYRVLIAKTVGLPFRVSFLATLCDRLSALAILIVISGPSLLLVFISANHPLISQGSGVITVCVTVLVVTMIVVVALRNNPITSKGTSLFVEVFLQLRSKKLFTNLVVTSLTIQFTTLFVMTLIANKIGNNLSYPLLFGIMAASLLVSRLPISVAGWGVRESLLVSLFSSYGISSEHALAISITYGLTELIAAMIAFSGVTLAKLLIKN